MMQLLNQIAAKYSLVGEFIPQPINIIEHDETTEIRAPKLQKDTGLNLIMEFINQKIDVLIYKPKSFHYQLSSLEVAAAKGSEFKPDRIMERQYHYPVQVSWLWRAKQYSRACFLMVLEFMPLLRDGIGELLIMLKKRGTKEFYKTYVQASHQFFYHANCELKKKYNIKLSNLKREQNPNFHPLPEQLLNMTRRALLSHRIDKIIWTDKGQYGDANLYSLSFGFNDGTISPPHGSYDLEPSLQILFPLDLSIGCIEFGRQDFFYNSNAPQGRTYKMCALRVFDRQKNMISEIKPDASVQEIEKSSVQFEPQESIVSVQVGTAKNAPVRIRFLISTLCCCMNKTSQSTLEQHPLTNEKLSIGRTRKNDIPFYPHL